MIRYRLWLLAATLLSMSLCLIACTGNPGGSNANSASTKPAESAQNRNNSTASPGQAYPVAELLNTLRSLGGEGL